MSDPSKDDPVGEFAKELARQLPVKKIYNEAISPTAKQTGQLAGDIAKAIHLALAPLQFLAAYQDRLRHFIDTSVRRVPKDKQVSPAPQILGPVVEGIRYEPEGTPIDEMFSQLLSRAIDNDRVHEAHPAFPIIIKQLSSDEAKILVALKSAGYEYIYTSNYERKTNLFYGRNVEADKLPRDGLVYPDNVPFYMDHLHQLGLAGIYQLGNQEPLMSGEPRVQTGVRVKSEYRLSELGVRFVKACT